MSPVRPMPFEQRYIPEPNTGCWLWLGCIDRKGYGELVLGGRAQRAHRVSYEIYRGPIPDGQVIDHLCRNRVCVNPAHLEPVTNKENVLRGKSLPAHYSQRSHCARGHEFSVENTRIKNGSVRVCRTCDRQDYHRRKNTRSIQ